MVENFERQELNDRLSMIESMIAEGRQATESWGWSFLLWGVAYYVAIGWSIWGRSNWAWPVTMTAAIVVTIAVATHRRQGRPGTTLGRAIGAVWKSMGISLSLLLMCLAISGKLEPQSSVAIVGAILGMANAASSMILKWKMQFACALVWWALAVFACFGNVNALTAAFLVAIFLCQIVFGIYAMVCESRRRQLMQGAANA